MSDALDEPVPSQVTLAMVTDLLRRVEALEAENRTLRHALAPRSGDADDRLPGPSGSAAGSVRETTGAASSGHGAVSRRRLLGAAAGVAAVGAAGVLASAQPAAAANGNNLVLGTFANTATGDTAIVITGSPGYGFGCIDTSFGGSFATTSPAIFGYSRSSKSDGGGAVNTGGWFLADGAKGVGVRAESTNSLGFGLQALAGGATGGTAIAAQVTGADGTGIHVDLTGATGGVGMSIQGGAVAAEFFEADIGVIAEGATTGIEAHAPSGIAAVLVADHAHLQLTPYSAGRPSPLADATAHSVGDIVEDGFGNLWLCVVAGTPGRWRKLAGPGTAGAYHLLPVPVRVYDSRPGTKPTTGTKSPLIANTPRTLNVSNNSSGVPHGATGVMCNLLVVNANAGIGNFTIWANGAARPASNNMVWGGSTGRFSSLAVTALDPNANCQVVCNVKTDLALDIVGYYL